MRYTWLAGLVLSGLPAVASAGHPGIHVHLGLPSISVGVGFGHGHYYHPYYRPAFYGGWCGPGVYIGAPYYYGPQVVYSAPPTVVYTTPAPQPTVVYQTAPQPQYAPAPQYVPAPQYAPAPQQQYAPAPQPAPAQPAPSYYYGQ